MKKLLIIFSLVAMARSAGAVPQYYDTSCVGVVISTYVPTDVSGNVPTVLTAGQFPGPTTSAKGAKAWAVKVTNLSTTFDLWCSQDVAISTNSLTHLGDQIVHNSTGSSWLSWLINLAKPWYCISNGTTAQNADVCTTK